MVLGIVAEYNPFHNGHLYHLLKSKELTEDDYSIAVIGGNFTQRGEASIIDKWTKAEMALDERNRFGNRASYNLFYIKCRKFC